VAISTRLRFEILRRDNFRCTYCGATPDEGELHIDHVVPVALGGTDIAQNLTTACAPCNTGKGSTSPSEELVAEVDRAVAVAVAAQKRAAEAIADEMDALDTFEGEVAQIWDAYVPQYRRQYASYPDLSSISTWHAAGVPLSLVEYATRLAVQAGHVPWPGKAGYMAAIIRNKLREVDYGENQIDQT